MIGKGFRRAEYCINSNEPIHGDSFRLRPLSSSSEELFSSTFSRALFITVACFVFFFGGVLEAPRPSSYSGELHRVPPASVRQDLERSCTRTLMDLRACADTQKDAVFMRTRGATAPSMNNIVLNFSSIDTPTAG